MKKPMSLRAAIKAVEQSHFRTEHDSGANSCAEIVMNAFRRHAGLPFKSAKDLPKWNGTAYVINSQ
jgi:hypothetical protein